jgi:Protein of unknown function (DUF4239)
MLNAFADWLCTLPPTLATLLAVGLAAALSVGCLFAIHAVIPHRLRSLHNDVAGFVLAIVGVIYAVLLAFIAIAVWQSYTAADDLVQTEANLVDDLYRSTISLPPGLATTLRQDLYSYTETVMQQEWPQMTTSMPARIPGWLSLDHFHLGLIGLHPQDASTLAAQSSMLQLLNKLYDVRRGRYHAAESSLPAILWWNLLAGAVILMVFSSLFGTPRLAMHAVMVGLLGGSIGLVLMLVVLLDNPFVGQSQVSVEPFKSLTRAVETMDYPHP